MHTPIPSLSPLDAYKLLTNIIVPRPIAWVVSKSATGHLNAAPYSFFNILGAAPPVIAIGVGTDSRGQPKHTAANLLATHEFTINMVTEDLAPAMNITAIDFPDATNELLPAGLTTAPSSLISVPRIAEARVALECRYLQTTTLGHNHIYFGEILSIFTADGLLDERHALHNYHPIGRLGSPSWYARTSDCFELHRIRYADWLKANPQPPHSPHP